MPQAVADSPRGSRTYGRGEWCAPPPPHHSPHPSWHASRTTTQPLPSNTTRRPGANWRATRSLHAPPHDPMLHAHRIVAGDGAAPKAHDHVAAVLGDDRGHTTRTLVAKRLGWRRPGGVGCYRLWRTIRGDLAPTVALSGVHRHPMAPLRRGLPHAVAKHSLPTTPGAMTSI